MFDCEVLFWLALDKFDMFLGLGLLLDWESCYADLLLKCCCAVLLIYGNGLFS